MHSISRRAAFSRNLHLLEEETLECLTIVKTLISQFSHFISKAVGFGWLIQYLLWSSLSSLSQEWLFLNCLYYLELSLAVLQNCRVTAFVNLWLAPSWCQGVAGQRGSREGDKWVISPFQTVVGLWAVSRVEGSARSHLAFPGLSCG